MHHFKELFQTADWKKEKHTPFIDIIGEVKRGEKIRIEVSVGKEIPHPNTTAHHISWIDVFFLPEGEKFPYHIGRFEFLSHGASTQGQDTSSVYSEPYVVFELKTEKSGEIFAFSYCNIHGLWANSKEIKF
ncbi:MAG: class II SORL domain-containing protein [Candidatus Hydrothermales bacterium]